MNVKDVIKNEKKNVRFTNKYKYSSSLILKKNKNLYTPSANKTSFIIYQYHQISILGSLLILKYVKMM